MRTPAAAGGRRRGARASAATAGATRGPGRAGDPVVRALVVATALLAAVAALVVVLSDDGRWLRLGVVAGLWATLLAVAALGRRSAGAPDPDAVAREAGAMRRTYELELQAEIDARREYELTVEQTVRRELAAERGEEIAGLRAEIERLRTHLESAETRHTPHLRVVASGDGPSWPVEAPRAPGPPAPVTPLGAWPSWAGSSAPVPPTTRPSPGPSADGRAPTGGRTVAELLAAHAAETERRRR